MSEDLLATVITVVLLAAMFAWVPILQAICPPCSRFFERRRRRLPVARRTTYRVTNRAA